MSKRVKHSRIYGAIKAKSVSVCAGGAPRGPCNRPRHSFLLTDAGPRGESQLGRGEDRGAARLTSPAGYW